MLEKIRDVVLRKRQAYRAIFMPTGEMSRPANIVLTDLRRFCRASVSTVVVSPTSGTVDPYASFVAEGRREVWNRIAQNLNLSDADLHRLIDNAEE